MSSSHSTMKKTKGKSSEHTKSLAWFHKPHYRRNSLARALQDKSLVNMALSSSPDLISSATKPQNSGSLINGPSETHDDQHESSKRQKKMHTEGEDSLSSSDSALSPMGSPKMTELTSLSIMLSEAANLASLESASFALSWPTNSNTGSQLEDQATLDNSPFPTKHMNKLISDFLNFPKTAFSHNINSQNRVL